MDFSTYRRITWIELPVFGVVLFVGVSLLYNSLADGVIVGALFTLLMAPYLRWSLSGAQARLDQHHGSIPLSWIFDWKLVDDQRPSSHTQTSSLIEGTPIPEPSDPSETLPQSAEAAGWSLGPEICCPACGEMQPRVAALFCRHCGASLQTAQSPGAI